MQYLINCYSDGKLTNLPWLLTEQESDVVKEVIQKIKFPIGFSSNINNVLTNKGDFGGVRLIIGIPLLRFKILQYLSCYDIYIIC